MSRYYFDLRNGDGPLRDEHGIEIGTRSDIVHEVTKILVGLASDELPTTDRATISVKVRDEDGKVLSVSTLFFRHEWIDVR
ncbi:hypothetical protein FHX08_001386 [Rhizobium sp. BK529]|uniref:DUF6894 family protein n=1 Tax=unclassified Rhizobium TaxID=2613769 RepID=UPI00105394D0|nr:MULTISPECIES: hypothetical protein [unclassified Rhizobium]MBB3591042.1 hypothetical protein [Rhizobium sp. BK529]TCS09002.1 hypothetical protein EV281_101883 [Rhizobium sp. BK418]